MKKYFTKKTSVFKISLSIFECTNITQRTGKVFCKWKLSNSFGNTPAVEVSRRNTAEWINYVAEIPSVSIPLSKENILKDCTLRLSVRYESKKASCGYERLGSVNINLSTLVGRTKSVPQKYLLEKCSLNSTLLVQVESIQVQGDPMFKVPEIRGGTSVIEEHEEDEEDDLVSKFNTSNVYQDTRESVFDAVGDILKSSEEIRDLKLPSR